ncbi:cyclodeaminase/cyclohydrolase family protein [bacterium]|nr:cyclodeaminase/cyclohydrolase family protein [FCB group bacterium]MBL7190893.1 cyclodeaminase/cyclohydrolase family protein [bacterium]
MLTDKTIKAFLNDLASPAKIPDGCNSSMLCGGFSAALTMKVFSQTMIKRKEEKTDDLKTTLEEIRLIMEHFILLNEKYLSASDELLSVYKKFRNREESKKNQMEAVHNGAVKAVSTISQMIKSCEQLLYYIKKNAIEADVNLLSDIGAAALINSAAAQSAAFSANNIINGIMDRKWAIDTFNNLNQMLGNIRRETEEILKTASQRMSE